MVKWTARRQLRVPRGAPGRTPRRRVLEWLVALALVAAAGVASPRVAEAGEAGGQQPPAPAPAPDAPANPTTICGQPIPPPSTLPPAGSGPVIYLIAPCWAAQGNVTLVEPATYLYYINLKPSQPSQNLWVPYDEAAEKRIIDDFHQLWNTNFLDNLWVEVKDYRFANGVVGKLVIYNMEERQRVKIIDYAGSKEIEATKVDEKLKELNLSLRTDAFIDAGLVRKVAGVVQDMMKEKGFQAATVTPEIKE